VGHSVSGLVCARSIQREFLVKFYWLSSDKTILNKMTSKCFQKGIYRFLFKDVDKLVNYNLRLWNKGSRWHAVEG
jgi:tRNA A37 N6-isopentenylltransferase MiaA